MVASGLGQIGLDTVRAGVRERSFLVNDEVPAVLWTPAAIASGAAVPLVLLGHGGSGHKRSERIERIARRLAGRGPIAALAIDGPFHGDRRPQQSPPVGYQDLIAAAGALSVLERMVCDWLAAVEAVTLLPGLCPDNLGYLGLSMATRYGIPTAAALAGRLRCAVFGKFGLHQSTALPTVLDTTSRIQVDAPRITAPTLLCAQAQDELFPIEGQLALYELLGASDKQLVVHPGGHQETHEDDMRTWLTFLFTRLCS